MSDTVEVTTNIAHTGKKVRPFTFTAPAFVWGDLLQNLAENGETAVNKAVADEIQKVYSGSFSDDDVDVSITPTEKNAKIVADSFTQLGLDGNLENATPVPINEKTPRAVKEKTGGICEFSGEPTKGGKFLPGGDMKMKGGLYRIIDDLTLSDTDTRTVGIGSAAREYTVQEAMDKVVSYGWYTAENIAMRRRNVQKKANDRATAATERAAQAARDKAAKAEAAAAAEANTADPAED